MSPLEQGYEDATIPPPSFLQYNTPPALIAFTFALLVLCFVAFSVIYLCKYCLVSLLQSWALQSTSGGGSSLVRLSPNNRSSFDPLSGLDPSLLHMFPTFLYSSVKDLRMENKYGLECAVCLLEFEDNSMLRHLTACCHVFHQECIDLWLLSHKTCPVCRTHLDSPSIYSPKSGAAEGGESTVVVDIRIDITREGELGDIGGESTTAGDQRHQHHDHEHDNDQEVSVSVSVQQQQQQEHVFKRSRSHSTGHSMVLIRGDDDDEDKKDHDRYTLRLPEHVIIRGRNNSSKSCASYQEMQMNNRPLVAHPCSSNCVFVESVSGCSNSLNHAQKT